MRNFGAHPLSSCSRYGSRFLVFLCLIAQPAGADATPQERAEELFSEGLRLMQSEHCQDAVPFFIESQHNDPAAATLANLATCYVRLGKTGSAYSTYKQAARAAILENKPDLQKKADQAALSLAPALTQLRVVPLGNGGLPDIKINGEAVEDVRKPIPLDPGENIIEATAPGHEPWRRILSTHGEGTLMVVEVPDLSSLREPAKAEPAMQPVLATHPPEISPKRADLRPYAAVAAGVGVVAVGVGTALTFSAMSKQNAANSHCDGRFCTQAGIDLRNQALDRAEVATWSVGFGLVSLGAAAALWFLSPGHSQESHGHHPQPWLSVGQSATVLGLQGQL